MASRTHLSKGRIEIPRKTGPFYLLSGNGRVLIEMSLGWVQFMVLNIGMSKWTGWAGPERAMGWAVPVVLGVLL